MDIINKDFGDLQLNFEESDLFPSQSTLPGQNEKNEFIFIRLFRNMKSYCHWLHGLPVSH